jgi:hypothetical protein
MVSGGGWTLGSADIGRVVGAAVAAAAVSGGVGRVTVDRFRQMAVHVRRNGGRKGVASGATDLRGGIPGVQDVGIRFWRIAVASRRVSGWKVGELIERQKHVVYNGSSNRMLWG